MEIHRTAPLQLFRRFLGGNVGEKPTKNHPHPHHLYYHPYLPLSPPLAVAGVAGVAGVGGQTPAVHLRGLASTPATDGPGQALEALAPAGAHDG